MLLLFIPLVSFGQTQPIKVQVTQQPTFAQSFNQGLQAGAAARSARAADGAAQTQANANNYENIKTDYLIGNSNNYKTRKYAYGLVTLISSPFCCISMPQVSSFFPIRTSATHISY